MAYICLACGHIFEEGEEAHWKEECGEYWGTPCYEEYTGCPICKGNYEEAVKCEICGSEHLQRELNGGVCDECIDEYRKDFDTCYKISFGETKTIEINSLLASLFDVLDIEQILKEYIRDKWKDVSCDKFIDSDKYWFGEKLIEEVKKNENSKK